MDTSTGESIAANNETYLEDVVIEDRTMKEIVLDYLLHECYGSTAEAFFNSICSEPEVPSASLAKSVRKSSKRPSHGFDVTFDAEEEQRANESMDIDLKPVFKTPFLPQQPTETDITAPKPTTMTLLQHRTAYVTLQDRKQICDLILQGDISEAIQICNNRFSSLLSINGPYRDIFFQLQCQKFIEAVRSGNTKYALHLAQTELAAFGLENQRFLSQLQDVIALLAYNDPSSSPVAHLLHLQKRHDVMKAVNGAILQIQSNSPFSLLSRIVQQTMVVQDLLSKDAAHSAKLKKTGKWNFPDPVKSSHFMES